MVLNIELNKVSTTYNGVEFVDLDKEATKVNETIEEAKFYGSKTLKSGKVVRKAIITEATTKYPSELEEIYNDYKEICGYIYVPTEDGVSIDNENKEAFIEEYFGEFNFTTQQIFFYFMKLSKAIIKMDNFNKKIEKLYKEQYEQNEEEED